MRRLVVPLALLAAAAVISAGVSLVLDARGGSEAAAPRPAASMSVVSASVQPRVHAFGDPVVAELELLGDGEAIDPDSVRLDPRFAPYESAGPVQVERAASGPSVRWRIRYPLRCLREGCAPDGDRRVFEFPLTNVVYRFRNTPGRASALVDWPSFQVTAGVDADTLSRRAWRAETTSVPEPSYRWSPGSLAAVLLAASIAFAALGVGLAWWLVRRREAEQIETEEAEEPVLSPLERALELARDASRNGDSPERRKALERVARELGARGLEELAECARALAWAPGGADPIAVNDLARRARAAANGGAS